MIVVANSKNGDLVAKLYHSSTGIWTNANLGSDLVSGYQFRWLRSMDPGFYWTRNGPCAYDCAGGRLLGFNLVNNYLLGATPTEYELVKDRLFVAKKEKHEEMWKVAGHHFGSLTDPEVSILEYQCQKRAPVLTKVKEFKCSGFGFSPGESFEIQLLACTGFVMLIASRYIGFPSVLDHAVMVYDLSTGDWHDLPAIQGAKPGGKQTEGTDMICELQRDAVHEAYEMLYPKQAEVALGCGACHRECPLGW